MDVNRNRVLLACAGPRLFSARAHDIAGGRARHKRPLVIPLSIGDGSVTDGLAFRLLIGCRRGPFVSLSVLVKQIVPGIREMDTAGT